MLHFKLCNCNWIKLIFTITFFIFFKKSLENDIYYGKIQDLLRVFRNYYLFILYAGAFIAVLSKLFCKKDSDSIWQNISLVILIGGLLFSLLWESKSRYVMPYVVMLVPYGAYGLYQIQHISVQVIKQMRRKTLRKE